MAVAVYHLRLVVFIMLQPYRTNKKAKIKSQVYCLLNFILQYFTAHYATVFRWCRQRFVQIKNQYFLEKKSVYMIS